jgi:ribosomal protein L7/L12
VTGPDDPAQVANLAARLDYVERQLASLWRQQQLAVPYVPFAQAALSDAPSASGSAVPPVDGQLSDPGSGLPAEVVALVRAGRKIDAVMAYRKITGAGMQEAKLAVDTLL